MVKEYLHRMFGQYNKGEMPIALPKHIFIREKFSEILADLCLNKCVEVGVHYGKNAYNLCANHPNISFVGVDPWTTDDPVSKAFGQEKQNKFMRTAMRKLDKFNARLMRMTSMEAVKTFADESLDFVFIDGAHDYDHVIEDLTEWSKKVKHDGIVAGHDYCYEKGAGVIRAVNEFVQSHGIDEWFVTKGRNPSFFWSNP